MAEHLLSQKIRCYVLDGDKRRKGINHHLRLLESDKAENIGIVAEIAYWMNDAGLWAIVALISPKKTAKENARSIIGDTFFKDINLNTPISICENGTLRTYI